VSIRVAYFEEFKGGTTLLIVADVEGLSQLASTLESVAMHEGQRVDIAVTPSVATKCTLQAECAPESIGVVLKGSGVLWVHDRTDWLDFAKHIRELAQTPVGHTYVDGPYSDIHVMISIGEGYEKLFA
jgi:hypothetical protein